MRGHRWTLTGALAGAVILGLTTFGFAQPAGHPPMGGMGGGMGYGGGHPGMMFSPSFMKDELKLSEKQIAQFKALRKDYERENIRRRADIKIEEMDLWDLFEKKDVSASEIEKKVRSVEAKKTDLRVYRFKQVLAIKEILSPEQFETFRSMGMMMFGGAGRYGMGPMNKHNRGQRPGYGGGRDYGSDDE